MAVDVAVDARAVRGTHQAPTGLTVAGVLLVLLVAAATALNFFAPMSAAGSSAPTVRVDESGLEPASLEVAPGTAVTWRNEDSERRRIRSVEGPGEFDSGNLEPGESFTHTFEEGQGTYRYEDHRNDEDTNYHGTVTVAGAPQAGGGGGEAAGGGGEAAGGAGAAGPISMRGRTFTPPEVTVQAGETVEWINDDDEEHTVTATDGAFDSGTLAEGAGFSHTFTESATYSYVCQIHPQEMRGTIVVQGADGSAPPASAQPQGGQPGGTAANAPAPGGGGAGAGVAAGGGGGAAAGTAGGDAPSSASVTMRDIAFDPPAVTVAPGGTVTWTNEDGFAHTVTAGDGSFDSGEVGQGGTFSQTFDSPGEHAYVCSLHPGMEGVVVVSEDAAAGENTANAPNIDSSASGAPGSGGASGGDQPEAAGDEGGDAPQKAAIDVDDFFFDPEATTIGTGGTVTWTNVGEVAHTVSADDGAFDSGDLDPGDTFEHTFEEAGTYSYVCAFHPNMVGTIEVVDGPADEAAGSDADDESGGAEEEAGGATDGDASGAQTASFGSVPLLPVALASGAGAGVGLLVGLVLLPALARRGRRLVRPSGPGLTAER